MKEINHLQARRYLHLAADGLLQAQEKAALEAHLAHCAECRTAATEMETLQTNLRRLMRTQWNETIASARPLSNIPTSLRRKTLHKQSAYILGTLAAATILLLAVTGAIRWLIPWPNAAPAKPVPETTPEMTVLLDTPTELPALSPAFPPSPSPNQTNGEQIAFVVDDDQGRGEIYVIGADGSNPRNLTNNPADDNMPTWSPDGHRLAFYSVRDGMTNFYAVNADGSNLVQLTHATAEEAWIPGIGPIQWSPDGSQLAVMHAVVGPLYTDTNGNPMQDISEEAIYLVKTDGTGAVTKIINTQSFDFQWSPDGQWLAFSEPAEATVKLIKPDGTGLVTVGKCPPPLTFGSMAWSPDGTQLVYVSAEYQLRLIHIEQTLQDPENQGGNLLWAAPIPSDPSEIWFGDLKWSPDGSKLLFTSNFEHIPQIYILGIGEESPTAIATLPKIEPPYANELPSFPSPVYRWTWSWAPQWAPDSNRIVYADDPGKWERPKKILLLDVPQALLEPTNPLLLTGELDGYFPQWQPRPRE